MREAYPLKIGAKYELVPCPSKNWPVVAFVKGKILYFNDLEELELDGKMLRLYFPYYEIEFCYIKKEWWRFVAMYGKEEIVE